MKLQQRLVVWILFAYTIEVYRPVIGRSVTRRPMNRKAPSTNTLCQCPQIDNEDDVVTLSDFKIPINPANTPLKSYGSTDRNGYITRLKIIKEKPIPSTIFGLVQLKQLEVRKTCFSPCEEQTIPSHIQCLAFFLTELSIYDTKITHLPDEISRLVRLKTLKLSNTGLVSLPDAIGNLRLLTNLYLPNNNLKFIPATIQNLLLLQDLTLSDNPELYSIEPVNDLHTLMLLDTRNCPIEILPRNLPKLTYLSMINNSLTNLNGIGTLGTNIDTAKEFYFDENSIESVSPGIGEVENLRWLKLDHNKLTTLPKDIFNIPTLAHLDIQYNQFHPDDLEKFVKQFRRTNPNLELLYLKQEHLS